MKFIFSKIGDTFSQAKLSCYKFEEEQEGIREQLKGPTRPQSQWMIFW